ncbi:MAG TPA: glycosyl hydrolase [Candidatus Thiothrix moscowensis]|uniref:glycoside hydrolase family 26 protein n=1 Tax=unclassified Thiothrix TaxID=2636184 RepID=UPI0025ED98CC|nr:MULTISPECIES: glycosyl hydrolase [unclassified Thiothrix]HRJ53850.1 glycosyl hydrolase [Candidatus Thiothrix moscowensis]HRJ93932.1 glycosyl hydrolase [Candidatus Thiothrix moscowensis]
MANNNHASLVFACCLATLTLPAHASTMLGAYINHDGWSLSDIDKFNSTTAKPVAVVNLFTTFDYHWDSLSIQASNIAARGGTPMITLMPYRNNNNSMLTAIAAGTEDNYINSWISSFRNWRDSYPSDSRPTILLRFGHEFNGNWYPWSNDPETFKAAWRHIHGLFTAAGVNNSVEWVWCANNVNVDDFNDITRYYPGNDVVDWTGIDGYNWGSNFSFSRWKTFDETFSSTYVKLISNYPDKPVVIAEVASAEPGDLPDLSKGQDGNDSDASQSKDIWVQDMYNRIIASYPAIRAVAWFNTNKELSWALNETSLSGLPNTGLNGYNSAITNSYFLSTFTPLKTTTNSSTGGKKTGGGKPRKSTSTSLVAATTTTATTDRESAITGLQHTIDISRMPIIVGEKLLGLEAEGFRRLPPDALKNIRQNRLNINQY